MPSIKFTQFLFPDRRTQEVLIDVSQEVYDQAHWLIDKGFSLEIENNNQTIWMSVSNHDNDSHYDEFCPNGPEVPKKVDKVIREAFQNEFQGKGD